MLTQKGREPFIRMKMFLEDDNAVHKLVASQYKIAPEKLMRTGGYGGLPRKFNSGQYRCFVILFNRSLGALFCRSYHNYHVIIFKLEYIIICLEQTNLKIVTNHLKLEKETNLDPSALTTIKKKNLELEFSNELRDYKFPNKSDF